MTIHQAARQWSGPGGRRGNFRTRNQGHGMARRTWVCLSCRQRNAARLPERWKCRQCKLENTRAAHVDPYLPTTCRGCDATKKPTRPGHCSGCGAGGKDWALFFDSSAECDYFMRLWMMQDAGSVRGLKHHPVFPLFAVSPSRQLVRLYNYEADAEFLERDGGQWRRVVADCKPRDPAAQDPVFKLKRAHFEAQYRIPIRIVS